MPLVNAIEDCRIETWIPLRLPGAAPWVRAYNDQLFGEMRALPLPVSRSAQFLRSILESWWFGQRSSAVRPEVAQALAKTASAVDDAIASHPPIDADEAGVLDAQRGMVAMLTRGIAPTWTRLCAQDDAEGLGPKASDEWALLMGLLGVRGSPTSSARFTARRMAPIPASTSGDARNGRRAAAAAISQALQTDGSDAYLAAWRRVQALTDRVADELLRVVLPRRRLRRTHDHASGTRLDLRRAMQFSADPRQSDKLWMRTTAPDRRDPEFVLLLDRSTSMRHAGRIEASFDALVLLVEATRRVGIRSSVWSFAADVRSDLAPEGALDAAGRWQVGRLLGGCAGGTNLHLGLEAAGAQLVRSARAPRVLIVLSDGAPSLPDVTKRAITGLEAQGVKCIGLGLGKGTEAMREYFSACAVDVHVASLPARIGDLVLRAFEGDVTGPSIDVGRAGSERR
ncbi:MAG: VWA domain-containing protein, partial [Deltaproteobacteria bacterium]